jgi:hypothetical protein
METKSVNLQFGLMCDPFAKQLKKQGWKFDIEKVKSFQKNMNSIFDLTFSHLLIDSQRIKMQNKLYNKMVAHVAKYNGLKINK